MEPGVDFEGVWKKFRRGERHDSLRDAIPSFAKRLLGRGPKADDLQGQEFWSVENLSFSVRPGQAVGIIGPNGAGKSTTLKLLTKILRPTRGDIRTRGRIGALIEVAAGFHPDLTGRENVFLQGAIMGMSGQDIRTKFDDIVDFSGISAFIDTPVKRYSSGMNARLGFSIAAHLDPDVLIIDEVLAVGDLKFQQSAFGRLEQLVKRGVPVVVVSHQLDRVNQLCTHGLLLSHGKLIKGGAVAECIRTYLDFSSKATQAARLETKMTVEPRKAMYRSGDIVRVTLEGAPTGEWMPGRDIVGLRLVDNTGRAMFATGSDRIDMEALINGGGRQEIALTLNVGGGVYSLECLVWDSYHSKEVEISSAMMICVDDSPDFIGPSYCALQSIPGQVGAAPRGARVVAD